MPDVNSERVQLLRSWARTCFTSGKILDIGSVGANDPFLLRAIHQDISATCELVGIDSNISGLGLKKDNLYMSCGDLYALPFPGQTFDGCIFAEVLEHLYDAVGALRSIARVMKKGGTLLLSTPNPFSGARISTYWYENHRPWEMDSLWRSLGNLPGTERRVGISHVQFYDPPSLCNLLIDAGFTIAEVTTTNLSLPPAPFMSLRRFKIGRLIRWLSWRYEKERICRSEVLSRRLGVYTLVRAAL